MRSACFVLRASGSYFEEISTKNCCPKQTQLSRKSAPSYVWQHLLARRYRRGKKYACYDTDSSCTVPYPFDFHEMVVDEVSCKSRVSSHHTTHAQLRPS